MIEEDQWEWWELEWWQFRPETLKEFHPEPLNPIFTEQEIYPDWERVTFQTRQPEETKPMSQKFQTIAIVAFLIAIALGLVLAFSLGWREGVAACVVFALITAYSANELADESKGK